MVVAAMLNVDYNAFSDIKHMLYLRDDDDDDDDDDLSIIVTGNVTGNVTLCYRFTVVVVVVISINVTGTVTSRFR